MRKTLIQARKSFGFKQAYIAQHLGMATNSYQNIEYGKNDTSCDKWLKLFKLFGGEIPLNELMANTPKTESEAKKWN